MNVNDVVCVGAEPIAVLDYLAVEQTDPDVFEAIARGLKAGAEQAGVEIPGGEVAVLPELIRGHPSPSGFDLTAACFGTVALDAIVTGADCAPGDALIGLPSSGLHSNGYTLARRVLEPLGLDARPAALGGASVADALLEPTVIYVRAVLELLRSGLPVHGLAHITGGGLANLLRLVDRVGFAIEAPLPVPPVFELLREHGAVARGTSCGASSTWAAASSPSCRRPPPTTPSPCSPRTIPGTRADRHGHRGRGAVGVPALGVALCSRRPRPRPPSPGRVGGLRVARRPPRPARAPPAPGTAGSATFASQSSRVSSMCSPTRPRAPPCPRARARRRSA